MLNLRPQDGDTICALATPPGEGALALIRVSGHQAASLARKLCPFLPLEIKSHHIYFGVLTDPATKKSVDEVLVSFFKKGRSFTGEESVEISCHGGSFLSSRILELLIYYGGRLADRGEFSYRAFMNKKMDLVQAESVLQLIKSRSPTAHAQALKGLQGHLSRQLEELEKSLIVFLSHLEAGIDFSDRDIELDSPEDQKKNLWQIKERVQNWLKGFNQGRINQEGFVILLLGAVNAGKSSLFNHLIQADQAIVTQWPGTTRDILTARLLLKGKEFCIKDTAGLRRDPEAIETQGIEKTVQEIKKADLAVFLIESRNPLKSESFFKLEELNIQNTLFVFSKSDQITSLKERKELLIQAQKFLTPQKGQTTSPPLWLSSRTGEGVDALKNLLEKKSEGNTEDIFLSSSRQWTALKKIEGLLNKTHKLLEQRASPELPAFEVQAALQTLQQLLGKEYNEQAIKQIFKEFCLGK